MLAVVGSISAQTLADPVSRTFDYLHRAEFPESQLTVDGNAEKGSFPMRSALVGNANMTIRREAFDRCGYFDARFGRGTRFGSGEEPDLLLRVLLGRAKIVVEPAARILHRHSTGWRTVRRWAFHSGCAHTAILTKYFLQGPSLWGHILRYAACACAGEPRRKHRPRRNSSSREFHSSSVASTVRSPSFFQERSDRACGWRGQRAAPK